MPTPTPPPTAQPWGPSGPAHPSYPAYPTYPTPYGRRDLPPPNRKMAGWALGLSILNCFSVGVFVAIGLAIAVLVKGNRDGRNHGKGMAIAALIISVLWIMAFVVFVVLAVTGRIEIDDSRRDDSGEIREEQSIASNLLRAGDCLGVGEVDEMMRDNQYEHTAVPCSKPHSGEVYHVFDLADGDYPGDGEVIRLAENGCLDAFRPYVGLPPARSVLEVVYLHPESIGWRIADDREVICLVVEVDESTTGSLEGARR